eukprot:1089090_1
MEEKQTDDGQLVYLCNTIYKSLLEDWIHVLAEHPKHPIEPHYTCDILYCPIANRHYFNKMIHDINDETDFIFYRELLDSIHCYVYHLEDVGLRVFTTYDTEQNAPEIEDANTNLQLGHIRMMQKQKAKILNDSGLAMAMNMDKANKYDLTHHMQSNENIKGTLMDMICDFISTQVQMASIDGCHIFFGVLSDEEYDSESVKYDLEDTSQSNLVLHNTACCDAIQRYFYLAKLHHYTFSIGYRFYYQYWSQFKSE